MRLDQRGVAYLLPLILVLAVGCAETAGGPPASHRSDGPGRGYGPPPHAPAHGYRAKTSQGVEIVWDSGLGVYVVVDVAGTYYFEDRYYRQHDDGWDVSIDLHGSWSTVDEKDLPPGLRGKELGKGHGKGKAEGHDKDKWKG